MILDARELALMRLANQGVYGRFKSAFDCASALFGIQAQVQRFADFSISNRVKNFDKTELQNLYGRHSLIKLWGQRNTVHVFAAKDWNDLSAVFANRRNFTTANWKSEKISIEKFLGKLEKFVRLAEFRTRDEIRSFTREHAGDFEYSDYHAILQSTLERRIFAIPEHPHTRRFRHSEHCPHEPDKEGKDAALTRVMKKYFTHYAPASFSDFLHWSGLRKCEAESAFKKLEPQMDFCEFNKKKMFYVGTLRNMAKENSLRMLGKFDPLFVSYKDKTWIADERGQKLIWRPAGHVEAVLIANGELLATWRHVIKANEIKFVFEPLKKLNKIRRAELDLECERTSAFFNKKLSQIEFA